LFFSLQIKNIFIIIIKKKTATFFNNTKKMIFLINFHLTNRIYFYYINYYGIFPSFLFRKDKNSFINKNKK